MGLVSEKQTFNYLQLPTDGSQKVYNLTARSYVLKNIHKLQKTCLILRRKRKKA